MKLKSQEFLLLLLLLSRGRGGARRAGGLGKWVPEPDPNPDYNLPTIPLPPNPLEPD